MPSSGPIKQLKGEELGGGGDGRGAWGGGHMHAECGQAQTEGKMCLPRRAKRCIDAQCPTFKCSTNEALMSSDIVTGDMSIDQSAHVFLTTA